MSYSLGIDLGTTFTSASVYDNGQARVVDLAGRSAAMPSVIYLDEDGSYLVGDAAARRATTEPARAARQFKRRFGDTTPIFIGGAPLSADALTAEMLKAVIHTVTEREGGAPDSIALTHPANWGGYKLELFDQTIRRAGLDDVTTITEPEAAVLHYAQLERVPTDSLIAVFDLGGGTFDAAIVKKSADGTEFIGRPEGIERLGGIDFDQAIYAFVVDHLDGAVDELDLADQTNRAALERLRRECVEAKEGLSLDEAVSIPVLLPSVSTTVRITRTEFEGLIRPVLTQAIDALHRALASAGIAPDDLHAVLIAGGSSSIPLVTELVANELGRPVAVDTHPKHVVSMGAAYAAHLAAESPSAGGIVGGAAAVAGAGAAAGVAAAASAPDPTLPLPATHTPTEPVPTTPAAAAAPSTTQSEPTVPVAATAAAATAAAATAAAATAQQPVAATAEQPVTAPPTVGNDEPRSKLPIIAGAAVLALVVVGAVVVFATGGGDDSDTADALTTDPAATAATESTEAPAATAAPVATEAPAVTEAAVVTAAPVTTTAPTTQAPTTTVAPTTTLPFPADIFRSELTGIVNNGTSFVVTYDTLNFEPLLSSFHLHFHWNTFTPESVGSTSQPQGSWQVWDLDANGDKVFDGFAVDSVPAGATAICAVVATSTHAVDAPEFVADTVSCVDLPA